MHAIHITKLIILLCYVVFMVFIFVGGGFITNVLFNGGYDLDAVGLDNRIKLNIAKMTIIMFWIVFISLAILPVVIGLGYDLF